MNEYRRLNAVDDHIHVLHILFQSRILLTINMQFDIRSRLAERGDVVSRVSAEFAVKLGWQLAVHMESLQSWQSSDVSQQSCIDRDRPLDRQFLQFGQARYLLPVGSFGQ